MAEEYIPISQLPDLYKSGGVSINDDILVSRHNTETDTELITSYKANLYNVLDQISNDVTTKINNIFCEPKELEIDNKLQILTNLFSILSSKIKDLSNNLTVEWKELSTELKATEADIIVFKTNLQTEFNSWTTCAELSILEWMKSLSAKQDEWMKNNSLISNDITSWVAGNYVSLTGNQCITGVKTFTNDINGCALSAKWI